jgi:hypothetical protein
VAIGPHSYIQCKFIPPLFFIPNAYLPRLTKMIEGEDIETQIGIALMDQIKILFVFLVGSFSFLPFGFSFFSFSKQYRASLS